MPIDYSSIDRVFDVSFGKLDSPGASLAFPAPGTLSDELNVLIDSGGASLVLSHTKSHMLASGSVEMWHRAIHSFLWSVTLTETSPLWASVIGYYASHYVMRAFAHSMGIFKSFTAKKAIQIEMVGAQFVLSCFTSDKGEHPFYWNAVKGYRRFATNPLFYENHLRSMDSDSAHRTFANYTDHVNSFKPMKCPDLGWVMEYIEKISHFRLGSSVKKPSRDEYPDLQDVQILAFQRIVAFNDFLDERIPRNRFWRTHRRPPWCKDVMLFEIEDSGLESPSIS
ncbi:MAG TPA: hypothetical protein VJU86_19445 [Pyrinomonadaceae bacterium]|nr:hypothetical protein [Pyrinomonadaceae bacterium]